MQALNRRSFLKSAGLGALALSAGGAAKALTAGKEKPASPVKKKPNIIYILADDMGYGDVDCLSEHNLIKTPNLDKLAAGGMIFTDAHSSSAVCTPTRYGILTGRYNWRTRLKNGVLWGYSKHLINPKRMTVASLMKQNGYYTAAVGKWHLGLDYPTRDGKKPFGKKNGSTNIDFAGRIKNSPVTYGFDYFWGIPASLDMDPYIWVNNDKFVGKCTTSKAFHRPGPAHKDFEAVDVLPTITRKVVEQIELHKKSKTDKPMFVYFPLNAPHTPIVPTPQFKGKSKVGIYGDFVMQVDHHIGEVVQALKDNGMLENTLVIFTADNGCSPAAVRWGTSKNIVFNNGKGKPFDPNKHYANAELRGHKADIFEGGHRVPFIAHWPAQVKAGSKYNQTVCLTDLLATCADIAGQKLPDNAGEDSVSILPALLGKTQKPLREATVHHSINGSFSIRKGNWKLELCPGSGGWSYPRWRDVNMTNFPKAQLYDLKADPGETTNLYKKHPKIVRELTELLQKYVDQGRSTPGKPQKNEGDTYIWRADWPNNKLGSKYKKNRKRKK